MRNATTCLMFAAMLTACLADDETDDYRVSAEEFAATVTNGLTVNSLTKNSLTKNSLTKPKY
jgi:hypothetical protein